MSAPEPYRSGVAVESAIRDLARRSATAARDVNRADPRGDSAERARRQLPDRDAFTAPATFGYAWRTEAASADLPPDLDLAAAVILATHLVQPVLTAAAVTRTCDPERQQWR